MTRRSFSKHRRRSRVAFTLVELLTVITVVGSLLVITIPVAQSARARADAAQCVSNLRQIGTALLGFASESDGILPLAGTTIRRGEIDSATQKPPWTEQIAAYLGDDWRVFLCKTTARHLPSNRDFGYFLGARAAFLAEGQAAPVRLSRIANASRFILSGDSVSSVFPSDDADKDDYSIACPFSGPRPHGGKSNILFADGSVRAYANFSPAEMEFSYDGQGSYD